ncbi:hypothetical protein K437DRAFT_257453 [Tilletiaria anomala UBC 951]|uniref:Uncharacterized protein n=1 Tax=Tilletiaria anomala (strain ATCC 24038 / CBS 436.72 / UBC 951) TaxID=1037660 RepID=A0A066VP81_TILAU|nr:uncharacterized protein K437DRAFT_257453 [Tilletiaria anomala UBC 951]KDN43557.1 hypothetical protein K437DRAFT_257453 [Tilletiaria anomala UBC 951]
MRTVQTARRHGPSTARASSGTNSPSTNKTASNDSDHFRGAIRYKSKQEMIEIAESLGLTLVESNTRAELDDTITKHLLGSGGELRSNPRYQGLYDSLDRDARKDADSESDGTPDPSGKSPRKIAGRRSNAVANGASSAISNSAIEVTEAVKRTSLTARSSFEDLSSKIFGASRQAGGQVEVAEEAAVQGNALFKKSRKTYKKYEKKVRKEYVRVRNYASNIQHITAALLIIEAVVLLTALMPLYSVEFGKADQFTSVKVQLTGHHLTAKLPFVSISVPHPKVLISLGFWQPLAVWSIWTFAIPYAAAHIITFDRAHQASLFTFNFTRLVVLLYLAYIVPRSGLSTLSANTNTKLSTFGLAVGEPLTAARRTGHIRPRKLWSYDYVLDYLPAELSLLITGVATGFTLYDAIVHRPRA